MRRTLAGQVRQEDKALGAGRGLRRQLPQVLITRRPKDIAPPAERPTGRERHAHEVVAVGHGMAEGVQPA